MLSPKAALASTSISELVPPTSPAFVVSTLRTGGFVGTGAAVEELLVGKEVVNGEFWKPDPK